MVSAQRQQERTERESNRAQLVLDHLVSLGARRDEVRVSQEALARATGLTPQQVSWATTQLCAKNTLVMDRPRDEMVAYSYRVVR